MKIFCIISLCVSGLLAGLCVVALPFWLMGVPGVDNSYAKGWKIGLFALLLYPIGWLCIFACWLTTKNHVRSEHLSLWNLSIGTGSLVLLAVAAGVTFYAFKVMSRP